MPWSLDHWGNQNAKYTTGMKMVALKVIFSGKGLERGETRFPQNIYELFMAGSSHC